MNGHPVHLQFLSISALCKRFGQLSVQMISSSGFLPPVSPPYTPKSLLLVGVFTAKVTRLFSAKQCTRNMSRNAKKEGEEDRSGNESLGKGSFDGHRQELTFSV